MKNLQLLRICSRFASSRLTTERILHRDELEDEEQTPQQKETIANLTEEEAQHLQTIIAELSRPEAHDPKLDAVKIFPTQYRTERKTWLEYGCIFFSQFYDTVLFINQELGKLLPSEAIGIYAGTVKSGLIHAPV